MEKQNVTVRLDSEKVGFLDELAAHLDRDRSYLIKEAVESYIGLHRWQIERIKRAVAGADAGEFMTDEEVATLFDELLK